MKNILTLFLILLLTSCMPEENLPIRDMGETPEYFIECYCKPGQQFTLLATKVLPISENINVDFSQELSVNIHAKDNIELLHAIYTPSGSNFIYNYGSLICLNPKETNRLYLTVTTDKQKQITAQTMIPDNIEIQNYVLNENEVAIHFYTSHEANQNYYIYSIHLQNNDTLIDSKVTYLDYSHYQNKSLIEKVLATTQLKDAEKIILNLKRITKENYDYQISLNGANSANQSSITTPVPLKGNIKGALGIFTCYTEDNKIIAIQ